jgi:hypothetical protein
MGTTPRPSMPDPPVPPPTSVEPPLAADPPPVVPPSPVPQPSVTPAPSGNRGRSIIAALDITESGVWMTIGLPEGAVEVNLSEEGLTSKTVYSSRREMGGAEGGRRLRFVSVLERLGEDAPISFSPEEGPEKPQTLLRNLLQAARSCVRCYGPEPAALAVVVPGPLNELQRSLVVKAGEASGWAATRVVNRTLAVAMGSVGRSSGRHLVLAFDHSALEAATVAVEDNGLQVSSYTSDVGVCADQLDIMTMARIITAGDGQEAESIGGMRTFLWLKRRVQQMRRKLSFFDSVRIELPDGILGDGDRVVTFGKADLTGLMKQWSDRIAGVVRNLQGSTSGTAIPSVVVAGEMAQTPAVQGILRQVFPTAFVTFAAPHAATRGALTLTERERATLFENVSAGSETTPPPRQFVVRADLSRTPMAVTAASSPAVSAGAGLADGIINRVRDLSRQGKRSEAEAELKRLRTYVDALEVSLKEPEEVLRADGQPGDAGLPPAEPTPSSPEGNRPPVDEEKARRREYLRARDDILHAEQALKDGRFDQAVSLSHLAFKESTDPRIFRAMIKVHLRAGRQPPTVQNFYEHRSWLLCALTDDPTNVEVQSAVRTRFVAQAELLLAIGTPIAEQEARKTLDEMARYIDPGEAAAALIRRLAGEKKQSEERKES